VTSVASSFFIPVYHPDDKFFLFAIDSNLNFVMMSGVNDFSLMMGF